jgi:ABC-type proline/glycine betaine transport system permease subunit
VERVCVDVLAFGRCWTLPAVAETLHLFALLLALFSLPACPALDVVAAYSLQSG